MSGEQNKRPHEFGMPEQSEVLIADILARQEYLHEEGDECDKYNLTYGSKKLELTVRQVKGQFDCIDSYLETIGDESERAPRETTLLYEAAQRLILAIVAQTGRAQEYQLSTKSKSMKLWAETEGQRIFAWDQIQTNPDPKYPKKFFKLFNPPAHE